MGFLSKDDKSDKNQGAPIDRLATLVKGIDFAMLTTRDDEQQLRSRPMSTQEIDKDACALWFFSSDDSPKAAEILHEAQVNVSYAEPHQHKYVSVSGKASIVHDMAKIKQLWNPLHKAWFPEGLADPHLCLIRVDIEKAEYWDSPSSKMIEVVGFLKAALTGTEFKSTGEHERMRFQ